MLENIKQPILLAFDVSSQYRHYRLHSGIPRFVESLLKALEKQHNIKIIKFVNCSELDNRLDREKLKQAVNSREVAAVYKSGRCEGIDLHSVQLSVVHSTFYFPPAWMLDLGDAQWIHTIHDLRPIDDPSSCEERHVKLFRRMGTTLSRYSVCIHSVSRFTASRVRALWKIPASRIRVIHPGTPLESDSSLYKDRYHATLPLQPYILSLGTVQPAKDVDIAISAFERATSGLELFKTRLVVAGSDMHHEPQSATWGRLLASGRALRLKKVDDTKRIALLSEASAILCTSRYEGFGFVPLEAIILGSAPIISDAHPCLEIIPNWPYTFQTGNVASCSRVLSSVLTQREEVQYHLKVAANHIKQCNWSSVASKFVNMYINSSNCYENAEQKGALDRQSAALLGGK